ncbi:MAG TPA: LPS assembly lipoprotein LptE [Methylocella sp.]|jgi:LPS-assembly lipoprotein|nr:LPS assembly lipoprotein LptE [Methylocella sp.]
MSLVELWPHGGALPRLFAALLMCLPLSGCIQPLYGPLSAGGDVARELQAIAVEPIPNRLGHYLGDDLIFGFNGTGSQVPPKYRLFVTVTENVQTPLLDTVSGYPSAANVVVNADYRLMPVGGTEPVTKGQAIVVASYDRTSQRFSNLRAARDAEIRDAKTLADQIRTRVAAAIAARG